jgi:hypothetical protein
MCRASLPETVTEKSAGAVLGLARPFSLRVVRAGAPSLSLRSLQGQGGDFGFGSIRFRGRSTSPPEDGTRSRVKIRKGWASPRASRRVSHRHLQNAAIVDLHKLDLTECITSKTAPSPLLRFDGQPAGYGIPVHIIQFLDPLTLRPNIEIVKTRLPDRHWF